MARDWTENAEFSIRTETDADDVLVLELFGELDLATCETLEAELAKAEQSLARKIVVDLSALQFVDSMGLQLLLDAAKRSKADGGRVAFLRPAEPVGRLLTLTGTDAVFPFED